MNKANELFTGKLLSGDEWKETCGDSKRGICPLCFQLLFCRVGKSGKIHFSHFSKVQCGTKHFKPYKNLRSAYQNHKKANSKKQFLLDNSFACFVKCRSMAEGLTTREFCEIVQKADQLGIWSFSGLPDEYIPYILLTCRENYKKTEGEDERRTVNFYFVFIPYMEKYIDFHWFAPSIIGRNLVKLSPKIGILEEYPINSELENHLSIPDWFQSTHEFLNELLTKTEEPL